MAAEFASPRLSTASIDSFEQTDNQRNATLVQPLINPRKVAQLEASFTHAPQEESLTDCWTAFQVLMEAWDDEKNETMVATAAREDTASPVKSEPITTVVNHATAQAITEGQKVQEKKIQGKKARDTATSTIANGLDIQGRLDINDAPTTTHGTVAYHSSAPSPSMVRMEDANATPPTWNEVMVAFGQEIQLIRISKGLSLEQIRFKTQVPMYHLQALESGAVDQLPEEIFVRGFLTRICNQLGAEGKALLAQLPQPQLQAQEILAQWQKPDGSLSSSNQVLHLRSAHLYIGYATLLASATGGLAWSFQETAEVTTDQGSPLSSKQISKPQAKLIPAQRAMKLAFGSDMARPEHSAPELIP